MNGFLDSVRKQAMNRPDAVAFSNSNGESLSYADLWDTSDRLACFIHDTVPGNDPILVYGHKSPYMIVSFIACLKAGHAYVPTDSCVPSRRVANIFSQLRSAAAICVEELPELILADERPGVLISSAQIDHCFVTYDDVPDPSWEVSGDETQYIIFTSGSTGMPKGVEISADDVANFMPWDQHIFADALEPRIFVNQALFSFDLSVTELVAALSTGGTVMALTSSTCEDMRRMFEALRDSNATCWVSTPTFATMCLAEPSFSERLMPRLSTIFFCGEALHPDLVVRLRERFPKARIVNAYGPTESTVAVTSIEITPEMCEGMLPVGVPRPGTTIRILDRNTGAELPVGSEGEILICGDTVAKGYFGQPEKTAAAFGTVVDGGRTIRTYHTGDLGYLDDKGCLWCNGRIDDQVKIHGYRIELGEIDAALQEEPDIDMACAVVKRRHDIADHIVAHVQLSCDTPDDAYEWAKSVKRRLALHLPEYMVPRRIVIDEKLPTTPNGKVDRKRLQQA